MMRQILGLILLLSLVSPLVAGKYNPVLDIGDAAPTWKQLPGVDGKKHSLADFKDKKAVVLVFTCNSCPYAVDCEERLISLTKKYAAKGVAVIAVNVNKIDEDNMEMMTKRAKEQKFNFPYMFDESQKIGKDYGAGYTPEFFVLNKDRKIAYMGALDDSPNGKNIKKKYVEDALDAILAGGKPAVDETNAIGCRVRYERKRRRRKK